MIPGEYFLAKADIEYNVDCQTIDVQVTNTGDRPIQVGSHYHFYETNKALKFDRQTTRGFRLNIPAGTAVRFEPGQTRSVNLASFPKGSKIFGFNGEVMGSLEKS